MKLKAERNGKSLPEMPQRLFVLLALAAISALAASIAISRENEAQAFSAGFLTDFLILMVYFTVMYAIPLCTDGYRVLLPSLATVFCTILLICTTAVDMRMIRESREFILFRSLGVLGIAIGLPIFFLLYLICAALLAWDAKKDGLPPIFSSMSRKAYTLLYSVLIGVLLITGVTTSVIHHGQMTRLTAYMVSEDDYNTVMPNLRAVTDISEPEVVSHGFDFTRYAAINDVDHHEFLHARQVEWVLLGTNEHDPFILRANGLTADPAKDLPISNVGITGDKKVTVTPALAAQITEIVRGGGTPYKGEKEPSQYSVSHSRAHHLTVTVSFEGCDAFVWSANVVEFEGHDLLMVETRTDYTGKDSIFEHTYAYFELTELSLP